MASIRKRNFGGRIPGRQTENVMSVSDPSEPHRFQFNLNEANDTDVQTTADARVTQVNDNSQSHHQRALTADQLEQLFRRASSNLLGEQADEQEFFKRDASIKAPKTSKMIETPFPPDVSARQEDFDMDVEQLQQRAKQEAGPLIIERYSPGKNKIHYPLSTVTLTYNQPMIAVSSLDEQIHTEDIGISLTPEKEGRWRWTGTKTVQFEAKHRLPYSTKYTLTLDKARCSSTIGGKATCPPSRSSLTDMFYIWTVFVFRQVGRGLHL
jgi:hypothetical protein